MRNIMLNAMRTYGARDFYQIKTHEFVNNIFTGYPGESEVDYASSKYSSEKSRT